MQRLCVLRGFHVKNEFGDWIAVLHTHSAANALHQCAKRAPSLDLRGEFPRRDGAVFLTGG